MVPVPAPGSPGDDDDDEFDNNNEFLDDDDGVNDIGNRICCFICEEEDEYTSFPYTRDDNVITVTVDDDDDDDDNNESTEDYNLFSSYFYSRSGVNYVTDQSRDVASFNPSPASAVTPSRLLPLVLLVLTFCFSFLF